MLICSKALQFRNLRRMASIKSFSTEAESLARSKFRVAKCVCFDVDSTGSTLVLIVASYSLVTTEEGIDVLAAHLGKVQIHIYLPFVFI